MLISTEMQAVAAAMAAGLPPADAAEQIQGLCARVEVLEKHLTERKRHMLYLWTNGWHYVSAEDEDHLWLLLRQHLGIDIQTQDDMARWQQCPADKTVAMVGLDTTWELYPDQWAAAAGPGLVGLFGQMGCVCLCKPEAVLQSVKSGRFYIYDPNKFAEGTKPPAEGGAPGAA